MNSSPRSIDLTHVPAVPWAWVDEHVHAAIRGCSAKVLQNERRLNIGCPFRQVNGTTIRYKFGILSPSWNRSLGEAGRGSQVIKPGTIDGKPVLQPLPRAITTLKMQAESCHRGETRQRDFWLKQSVVLLLRLMRQIGTGKILRIEVMDCL